MSASAGRDRRAPGAGSRAARLLLGGLESLALGVAALAAVGLAHRATRTLGFPLDVVVLAFAALLSTAMLARSAARAASPRSRRRRRAAAGACFAAGAVAAAMSLLSHGYETAVPEAERIARHLLPREGCPPDAEGYRPGACLRPGFRQGALAVSAAGLWGAEPSPPGSTGGPLLVALGGSTTEGDQRRDPPESWPEGLARRLAAHAPELGASVRNGGVASYVSRDVLWQLRARVAPLAPDVVLVSSGWNDFKCHQLTERQRAGVRAFHESGDAAELEALGPWFVAHRSAWEREREELLAYTSTRARLLRSDPAYAEAAERVASWLGTDFELYDHLRGLATRRMHVWRPDDQDLAGEALFDAGFEPAPYAAHLRALVDEIRALGAIPVLLTQPHGFGVTDRIEGRLCDFAVLGATDWYRYHTEVVNPLIRRVAGERGALLVDVDARITPAERERFFRGSDGLHALEGGYLRFGEIVADELLARGILPARRASPTRAQTASVPKP